MVEDQTQPAEDSRSFDRAVDRPCTKHAHGEKNQEQVGAIDHTVDHPEDQNWLCTTRGRPGGRRTKHSLTLIESGRPPGRPHVDSEQFSI